MGLVKKIAQLFFIPLFITAMPIKGHCGDYSRVSSTLKTISKEDQQVIEDLFYLLFRHGDFAYAFFGIKPMCSIDYTMQYAQCISQNERFTRETHLARKGFDTWAKYQHLFPMKTLKIQLQESIQLGEHFAFLLINPEKCLTIIRQHLTLFQKYYGQELSSEELLELLCQETYFQEGKNDTTVLGLLLGYPEKDVLAFSKQFKRSSSSKNKSSLKPCPLALSKNPLTPIKTPYFMTNRSETELKEIKSEYALKKQELVKFYYSENFLEKVLDRFM